MRFDVEETFGDDYLYFYAPRLGMEATSAEADELVSLLDLPAGATVLDAPCGHGRLSNELAARRYRVVGLDRTAAFVALARADAARRSLPAGYVQGDLRRLPFVGRFDAAICWFTSFGYFEDEENKRALAEFRRVLRRGGILIIETLHHDAFVRGFSRVPATIVTEIGDDLMIDSNDFDALTGRIETDRTVVRDGTVRRSHHSVRLPTPPEFVAWLHGAGFDDVQIAGRRGESITLDTWRLVVRARAA